MAKILSVYNRLQAGDYENGNGGKRRVSRLTQFIHATLQLLQNLWLRQKLILSSTVCLIITYSDHLMVNSAKKNWLGRKIILRVYSTYLCRPKTLLKCGEMQFYFNQDGCQRPELLTSIAYLRST